MYLRFTQRTNTDGSVVRYAALAHNRRVEGKVKPDVLMNLGRVDQLDMDGLRRLAASITKHFGDGLGPGPSDAVEAGLAAGAGRVAGRSETAQPRVTTRLKSPFCRRNSVNSAPLSSSTIAASSSRSSSNTVRLSVRGQIAT